MKVKHVVCLLAGLLGTLPVQAQNRYFDASSDIFAADSVARIEINLSPSHLAFILSPSNADSDSLFPARMVFSNDLIVSDTLDNIGFRIRGNTSRRSGKRSFKLDFNKFVKGQRFRRLKELNVNGEHNDPSILRARLSWHIFQQASVAASRSAFAALYINGEYRGLYVLVEHYDDMFIDAHFGNSDGNLFKCLWPADLAYLGQDPELYKRMSGDRRAYALRTNKDADDYADLAEFIRFINRSADHNFARFLPERFNVEAFLKGLAVNVLVGMWDDYWRNKNNYYLYHNSASDKFEFIPYDYDNTFGIDWFGIDWGRISIYEFGLPTERPLVNRILKIPGYRNLYTHYVRELLDSVFNRRTLEPIARQWRETGAPFVENDPYYPLDYGYSYNSNWWSSLERAAGDHVKYGILDYISNRAVFARSQLVEGQLPAEVQDLQIFRQGDSLNVRLEVADTDTPLQADFLYRYADGAWRGLRLQANGERQDGVFVFEGSIVAEADQVLSYYAAVYNRSEAWTLYPQTAPGLPLVRRQASSGQAGKLMINEFMASNQTAFSDPAGEFDDWLELYNNSDAAVSLEGYFLTDDFSRPTKWALPDTTIAARGHLLVWADENGSQGPMHANFKLARAGEEIAVTFVAGSDTTFIDSLIYGPQFPNQSFGRLPDGGTVLTTLAVATPGASNGQPTSVRADAPYAAQAKPLEASMPYPNPAATFVQVNLRLAQTGRVRFTVYDVKGRRVVGGQNMLAAGMHVWRQDVSELANGSYFLEVAMAGARQVHKLLILR